MRSLVTESMKMKHAHVNAPVSLNVDLAYSPIFTPTSSPVPEKGALMQRRGKMPHVENEGAVNIFFSDSPGITRSVLPP